MEMQGTRQIAASREVVWAALNSAEVLKAAIPGCKALKGSPEEGFEATVKQRVGPVNATVRGRVHFSGVVPGSSYVIAGEGRGRVAAFAKGSAEVKLADKDGGTLLTYDVKASAGGTQIGSRLIDGVAKRMASSFFENFANAVEGPAAALSAAEDDPAAKKNPGFFGRLVRKKARNRRS